MAVNDIYSLDYVFLQDGREWMIGEYYRVSVDDVAKTPVDIATDLITHAKVFIFDVFMRALISDEVELTATIGQKIWPTMDFGVEQPWSLAFGNVSSPPLPAHTTQLIRQAGESHGRSFQGRVFLSGVPESFQDLGKINLLASGLFGANGTVPFGKRTEQPDAGSVLRMVHTNWSKHRSIQDPPLEPTYSDIQAHVLNPSLGTQRNRKVRALTFAP